MLRSLLRAVITARGGTLGMVQTGGVQIVIVFLNLATGILTARWLGPAGRGDYAAIALWFLLPASIAAAGLQSSIVYVTRSRPCSAPSVALAGLACGLAAYGPAAAVSLLLLPIFLHSYGAHVAALSSIAILASALNLAVMLSRQSLIGDRRTWLYNVSCAASPATYLAALLICRMRGALTLDSVFISQVATIVITAVAASRYYVGQRRTTLREIRDAAPPLIAYGVRAAGIDLVNIFYGNADRLILIGLISPADLGLYTVALSFARLISILQIAVSSVLLVDLADRSATEVETYVHNLFRALLWTLTLVCVVAFASGETVLAVCFGRDYVASSGIFKVLVVENSISCLCQVLLETFLASNRPGYPSRVQFAYSIALVALLFALAPAYGGFGAALAMLAASAVKMALLLLGLKRIDVGLPRIIPRGADCTLLKHLVVGRFAGSREPST